MSEMNLKFPPDLEHWIEMRLAEGRYADAEDYLRDLVRRDQDGLLPETAEQVAWVREQVAIGVASGVYEKDALEVLDEIRATRKARRG
jgi:antitoxin ParD1/3/4